MWFCRAVKTAFPIASDRNLLDSGWVKLRFIGFDGEFPLDLLDGNDANMGIDAVVDLFLHVGTICFNPYRPTLRVLTWPGATVDPRGRLELKVGFVYNTMLEALATIVESNPLGLGMVL